jgi:Rps23 Pro-64 3,4-dihydroxylase Tpa1-like proline 4-hydroxylase
MVFNFKKLDPNIFYYKNVINDPQGILKLLEEPRDGTSQDSLISDWNSWKTSGINSYIFGYKKNIDINKYSEASEADLYVYNTLQNAIKDVAKHYAVECNIELPYASLSSISKYVTGAYMGPHVDDYGVSNINPLISAVLYLNDDYEGGEINFPNQKIQIKPDAGSIVVFPSISPYTHESKIIASGEKYMAPIFWKS